jgi:hypothetical protein
MIKEGKMRNHWQKKDGPVNQLEMKHRLIIFLLEGITLL